MASLKYKNGNSWVDFSLTMYPVNSLYLGFSSTSPATLFGGTWVEITGSFLYANSSTATGGNNTKTITRADIPRHSHPMLYQWASGITYSNPNYQDYFLRDAWNQINPSNNTVKIRVANTPGNLKVVYPDGVTAYAPYLADAEIDWDMMPSYQSVYCWRRTA